MQQLEMLAYEGQRTSERRQVVYVVGNLEALSASVLYYGKGNAIMPGELTIRPLGPNTQLHIHEGSGGTAHIKTRDGQYQNIGSYEAAMLDLELDMAGVLKIEKTTKGSNKGRT